MTPYRAPHRVTQGAAWHAKADWAVPWVGGLGAGENHHQVQRACSLHLQHPRMDVPWGTSPESQHGVISQAEHIGQQGANPGAFQGPPYTHTVWDGTGVMYFPTLQREAGPELAGLMHPSLPCPFSGNTSSF